MFPETAAAELSRALAFAIEAASLLASTKRWHARCERVGVDEAHTEVRIALERFVTMWTRWRHEVDDSEQLAGVAAGLLALRDLVRSAQPSLHVPEDIVAAARMGARPVALPPLSASSTPWRNEPVSEPLPPARVMAIGGGYTDAYSGSSGDEGVTRLRDALNSFAAATNADAAFVIDRLGMVLAESGTIDARSQTTLRSIAPPDPTRDDALRCLRDDGFLFHSDDRTGHDVYLQLVAGRILLVLVFTHRISNALVRQVACKHTDEMESAARSLRGVGELTDLHLDALLRG